MPAKAGQKAQETGDFDCQACHTITHLRKGQAIPKCPNCGNDTYDARLNEPKNPSTQKKSKASR